MSKRLLFGTDPEAFGAYMVGEKMYTLPPYYFRNMLGVTASDDPKHPVFFKTDAYTFHEDGAAFEMAIHPSHNPKDLWDTIQECAKVAGEKILSQFPDHCMPVLQFVPTIGFDVERWKNMGDDFRMSTRFGCDPDRDAFDFDKLSPEVDASLWPHRHGGGHIHISGCSGFKDDPILAVQCQALTTGLAAISYSDTPELDHERTWMYGRPGKYRLQNYGKNNPFGPDYAVGIEYRTPSNRWASDWNIAERVFHWAEIGVEIFENGLGNTLLKDLTEPVTKAILDADQKTAKELLAFVESKL